MEFGRRRLMIKVRESRSHQVKECSTSDNLSSLQSERDALRDKLAHLWHDR